ncbi:hypothetical protein ACNKHS_25615 [Shigella flexneri]
MQENIDAVNVVLERFDAHEISTLLVMTKIDMLDDFRTRIDRDEEDKTDSGLAVCRGGDCGADCFSRL